MLHWFTNISSTLNRRPRLFINTFLLPNFLRMSSSHLVPNFPMTLKSRKNYGTYAFMQSTNHVLHQLIMTIFPGHHCYIGLSCRTKSAEPVCLWNFPCCMWSKQIGMFYIQFYHNKNIFELFHESSKIISKPSLHCLCCLCRPKDHFTCTPCCLELNNTLIYRQNPKWIENYSPYRAWDHFWWFCSGFEHDIV